MERALLRVLNLQREWTPQNTPAMRERGELIRDAMPGWLREHAQTLASSIGIPQDDLLIEGRDGTGLKTRTPWVRVASRSRSPSATKGFYVVYLFDTRGDAVFLSLNQGTTDFNGGDFVRKPRHAIESSANWARAKVAPWASGQNVSQLRLHDLPSGLGTGYELGDVASLRYGADSVPSPDRLRTDLKIFCEALALLYDASAAEPVAGDAPEVEYAVTVARAAAGNPPQRGGAGFRLDSREIRSIEQRAVVLAKAHYEAQGWTVRDVGATQPYDLDARRGDERLHVEVKGTTSTGGSVVLTEGEVRHHAKGRAQSVLVVVRGIRLVRTPEGPRAEGGELCELAPWTIDPACLTPISYKYVVPPGIFERAS